MTHQRSVESGEWRVASNKRMHSALTTRHAPLLNVLRAPDFWLIVAAMVLALPSLAYPFGRDQALHYYVGRFMWHGLVPFRDAFDVKPPGIYLVYFLGVLLFGTGQLAIRIIDLLVTLGIGVLAAVAIPRDRRIPGLLGASVLFTTVYYYTIFDFWNSAQPEHFEGILLLAAWVIALRCPGLMRAAMLSGLCSAAAVLFKTPAALPALGVAGLLCWRAYRSNDTKCRGRLAAVAATHAAAGALVGGAMIACYAALGAGREFYEGMIGYIAYYQQYMQLEPGHCTRVSLRFWLLRAGCATALLAGLWWLGASASARRRDTWLVSVSTSTAILLALCVASVLWQGKGFVYHWAVVTPFLSMAAVIGLLSLPTPAALVRVAICGTVAILLYSPSWPALPRPAYLAVSARYWGRQAGLVSQARYLESFRFLFGFSYADSENLGKFIRDRACPGDQLHVCGFEPVPYMIADLTSPSRFPVDMFLTPVADEPFFRVKDGVEFCKMPQWRKQHWDALWTARPRFFVCRTLDKRMQHLLHKQAYLPVTSFGTLALFEARRTD